MLPMGINQEPLGDQFEAVGFESTNSIRNMGSTYFFILILIFILLLIGLAKILR